MSSLRTETTICKYPLRLRPFPQEVKSYSPLNEHILGPLSVGLDDEGGLSVWCLVERGERHPQGEHLYIQLTPTNGVVPGQECTFLGSVVIENLEMHAFWWAVKNPPD